MLVVLFPVLHAMCPCTLSPVPVIENQPLLNLHLYPLPSTPYPWRTCMLGACTHFVCSLCRSFIENLDNTLCKPWANFTHILLVGGGGGIAPYPPTLISCPTLLKTKETHLLVAATPDKVYCGETLL